MSDPLRVTASLSPEQGLTLGALRTLVGGLLESLHATEREISGKRRATVTYRVLELSLTESEFVMTVEPQG